MPGAWGPRTPPPTPLTGPPGGSRRTRVSNCCLRTSPPELPLTSRLGSVTSAAAGLPGAPQRSAAPGPRAPSPAGDTRLGRSWGAPGRAWAAVRAEPGRERGSDGARGRDREDGGNPACQPARAASPISAGDAPGVARGRAVAGRSLTGRGQQRQEQQSRERPAPHPPHASRITLGRAAAAAAGGRGDAGTRGTRGRGAHEGGRRVGIAGGGGGGGAAAQRARSRAIAAGDGSGLKAALGA